MDGDTVMIVYQCPVCGYLCTEGPGYGRPTHVHDGTAIYMMRQVRSYADCDGYRLHIVLEDLTWTVTQ